MPLLKGYHGIDTDTVLVKDGTTLDLGGHVLQFATVPMVHWPESMVTFDTTTGVLFSNDSFGGYGAHEGGLFDDSKTRYAELAQVGLAAGNAAALRVFH